MDLVVYTALFGDYDVLPEPVSPMPGCTFIAFTDNPTLTSRLWNIVRLPATMEPALMNRHLKLHPHLYVPAFAESMYVDANLKICANPRELADTYLARVPFAAPRHHLRDCAYEEIDACVKVGKISEPEGSALAARYLREGYPIHHGLTENRVLLRRHHDPAVVGLMEAWWTELTGGVKRDQASLQVVCWRRRFTMAYMTEDIICGRYFRYLPHKHARPVIRAKIQALVLLKRMSHLFNPPPRPAGKPNSPSPDRP